jgi:uncharacterized protein DUF4367
VNLEQELRGLGIDFPSEPDVSGRVLARIQPRRARRRWLVPVVVALALLGALFAIPQTRAAILRVLHIGNVEVERVETLPPAQPGALPLGRRVSLDEARDAAGIELTVPDEYRGVYAAGPFVTFVLEPHVWLLEWGGTGAPILKKVGGPGTVIEEVSIDGTRAIWIEGRHVVVRGPERRLAGNVLIWERNGVTYRLEGALSQERAVEIARNL